MRPDSVSRWVGAAPRTLRLAGSSRIADLLADQTREHRSSLGPVEKFFAGGTAASTLARLTRIGDGTAMATQVLAHITGTIWKIEVKEGDTVEEGQTVAILESMKMEMPIEAPCAGKVEKIVGKEAQAVNEGDLILTIA
jgi:acetyl-CoA carboxylase biotin carboxyl carrier protein